MTSRKFTSPKNRLFDRGKWDAWYPISAFSHLEASNQLNHPAAGDPIWGEFNTKGIVGAMMAASDDTMVMFWPFEKKFDHEEAIDMHVVWGHTSTDADTPTFKIGYTAQTDGAALSTTISSSVSVSDTSTTTANSFYVSDAANFAGGTFDKDTTYAITLACDTVGTSSANEIYIFGLWMKGTPNISRE